MSYVILHCAARFGKTGNSDRWNMQMGLNIMQGDTVVDEKKLICRQRRVYMCDFGECCGNFIASVVPKCYICSLQLEHAEGMESVIVRRFILKAII